MTPEEREKERRLFSALIYAALLGAGSKWSSRSKAIEAAEDLIDDLDITAPKLVAKGPKKP